MYIAIDGGGTKTEYVLLNEQFECVGSFFGGCVNHDFLVDGWEGTQAELSHGIQTLLKKHNLQLEQIEDVAAGISGLDTDSEQQCMEECMHQLGIKKYAVCNDGFLAVMAESDEGWGIAYNCGTGVCCVAIDRAGRQVKRAGFDEWSGDAGGGIWIVMEVYRQVYRDLFYRQKPSVFAQEYHQCMGYDGERAFLDSVAMLKQPSKYPELQKQVIAFFFQQFQKKQEEASIIGEKMLQCAEDNLRAVLRWMKKPEPVIPMILTGSILTKAANEKYLEQLKERLQNVAGNCLEIKMAENLPVCGAVKWLKKRNGKQLT